MFSDAHVTGKHDLNFFAACGQQTLRDKSSAHLLVRAVFF